LISLFFFPQLLLAADNEQLLPDPQSPTFTPYISANVSAGYDSGINLGTVNNHLNDDYLSGSYTWDIGIGFDGSASIRSLKDLDFKFIYGGYYTVAKPIGKSNREMFEQDKLGQLLPELLYFGLATPYGKLKVGNLSTNSLGLTPNFWSTGGVANLTLYERTFFPVTNAILYESPNFDGLSLHLVKGLAKRITGIYQRYDEEGSIISPQTEPVNTYGGTVQYQKNGSFIKYTGLVRQDGLLEKESGMKNNAYLHSIVGGLTKDNLFLALGYQYLYNNAGWGDTLPYMSDDQIKGYVGSHPETYDDKTTGYGIKYFAFPMHEIALSASYVMGKITPKFSIAYGMGANNEYSIKGKPESEYRLPGYIQYVAGIDYSLSNSVFLNLAYGALKWQHEAYTPKTDQWFDQKSIKLNLSYWYY
jgi:hypothetical protein